MSSIRGISPIQSMMFGETQVTFARPRGASWFANWALGAYQSVPQRIDTKWTKVPTLIKRPLKWLVKNFADQDYREMVCVNVTKKRTLGWIVADPPRGAMLALLFGFAMGGRILWANLRKEPDPRETKDILVRDPISFIAIIYLLEHVARGTSKALEWHRGIGLTEGNHVFSFKELRNLYTIIDENTLKGVLYPKNEAGVLRAVDSVMKHLNPESDLGKALLELKALLKAGYEKLHTENLTHFPTESLNEAWTLFTKASSTTNSKMSIFSLEKLHNERLAEGAHNLDAKMGNTLKGLSQKALPRLDEMFANYAKKWLALSVGSGILLTVATLGFGVVIFNWMQNESNARAKAKTRAQRVAPAQSKTYSQFTPVSQNVFASSAAMSQIPEALRHGTPANTPHQTMSA